LVSALPQTWARVRTARERIQVKFNPAFQFYSSFPSPNELHTESDLRPEISIPMTCKAPMRPQPTYGNRITLIDPSAICECHNPTTCNCIKCISFQCCTPAYFNSHANPTSNFQPTTCGRFPISIAMTCQIPNST